MDPAFVLSATALGLAALAFFLTAHRIHGAVPALAALGVGVSFGLSLGFLWAYHDSLGDCSSLEEVWRSVESDFGFVLRNRLSRFVIAAAACMAVSWISLRCFGPRLRTKLEPVRGNRDNEDHDHDPS